MGSKCKLLKCKLKKKKSSREAAHRAVYLLRLVISGSCPDLWFGRIHFHSVVQVKCQAPGHIPINQRGTLAENSKVEEQRHFHGLKFLKCAMLVLISPKQAVAQCKRTSVVSKKVPHSISTVSLVNTSIWNLGDLQWVRMDRTHLEEATVRLYVKASNGYSL